MFILRCLTFGISFRNGGGLGHTILSPSYNNSVYDISEMIINGNYFVNLFN